MKKLQFTKEGYLQPAAGLEINLENMREYFVEAFPDSKTRRRLFDNFEKYISGFKNDIFPWFEVWVNGSFVTHKPNPKDIDFVVFLDWEVYEMRGEKLERFYAFNLEKQGLDAFIVPVFSENHPEFINFENTKIRYFKLFSTDRAASPKGFLVLKFQRQAA